MSIKRHVLSELGDCVHPHHTYPSNHLKVLLSAEVNGFAVEKPLEDGTQGGITGHPARQHQALAHGGVQTQRRNDDLCGFYSMSEQKENNVFLFCSPASL